nr:hypothetical protein [Candidatus Sigynarchaeota archaeon]
MALAKSEMPLISQIHNSCGISSVLMALKPDKNKLLDLGLRKLEKKVTKALKISTERFDFQDRMQFAVAWLILHVIFAETDFSTLLAPFFSDVDNIKLLIESKFDEMVVYQKARGNAKVVKDLERLTTEGEISFNFLEAYMEEQKTDMELKFLGAMFGLVFVAVPEGTGGSPLGYVTRVDPRGPEDYLQKVGLLAKHIMNGAVLANYEFHWLALREIGKRLQDFKQEAKSESIEVISTTPHFFKFNNPLSGMILSVTKADILAKYNFYCFEFNLEQQQKFLSILKNRLKL